MNDNPWHVDDMARMQRQRIQEEMKQIRLQESARRSLPQRPSLFMRVLVQVLLPVYQLLSPKTTRQERRQSQQSLTREHAKYHLGR